MHKPKEAKENFINMQIYDINYENKHSSSIEITQSALSSIGCEISKVEITKFHTNEINNSKISNLWIQNNEFVESFGLSTRCKGEKLSKEQLDFLRKELESKDYTVNEISIKYGISPSTVRTIKKNSSNQIRTLPLRRYDKISEFQRNSIKQNIMQYYIEVESEFNSVDVQKYLFEKWDIICSLKVIRDIMKNDLNFSYKKCWSRSNIVDFDKVKALRILFSARLSIQLKEKILIWNIDEWTISRNTKVNYSWSIKGINKEVKNIPFSGNLYLILAVLSNGKWFLLSSKNTIESLTFCHFIKKLNNWIYSSKKSEYDSILLIMDNWSSHKSKNTINTLKQTDFKVNFLPIYSPDLSPVEMCFAYIKQQLWNICKTKRVNLSVKSSQNELFEWLKTFTSRHVKNWFSKFYKTIKFYLNLF